MVAPVLEEIARERVGTLKVVKVNTERDPDLAAQYQIRSIPSLLLFRNGKLVDQIAGALPKNELLRWIEAGKYVL
jgi:thioredoxin-like negative regulator of GroEL